MLCLIIHTCIHIPLKDSEVKLRWLLAVRYLPELFCSFALSLTPPSYVIMFSSNSSEFDGLEFIMMLLCQGPSSITRIIIMQAVGEPVTLCAQNVVVEDTFDLNDLLGLFSRG